jgi:hypothetical protein
MKKLAYAMAVVCVVGALMYFALPGGLLPKFMPGYDPGSTFTHKLYGTAALAGAVVCLLIGLSTRR